MIKNLLIFSLRNRWVIIAINLVLMAVGFWCFTKLKIEAYPDIADTNVIIVAQYDGRAAEEVEQQVTVPIERALQNTPNVLDRRSRTIFGLSVVQLTFKDGTDDYFARQQVTERLTEAELPDGVTPSLAPLSTAVGEIFRYVVEAPSNYSQAELRDLQDWVIKPALLQVPGIADVTTFGGPLKQFHIITSPEKLRKYNLTLQNVMDAVDANNQNTGGNIIERGGQGFAVRGLGAIKTERDIQNIVLKSENGMPIFVRDVATVEITPPPPSGVMGYTVTQDKKDVSSGVEGIILLRRYENPSEVLKLLKERMAELQENDLPQGVKLRPMYDRTFLIDHSLETVAHTLFEGISIVIILLILFLGSVRSALVVALTIPFALLFAFILMRLTGIPANLLSLGAIDFGIIVDGACLMAEHLIRKYRTATPEEKQEGIVQITLQAAQEVGREIFFSVTIIILAYMPILLMTRVEGKLFSPMALTLAFAVIGSMLGALTFIPVLISFVYRKAMLDVDKPIKEHKNVVLDYLTKSYEKTLSGFLNNYKKTTIIGFSIVAVFILCGLKLGTEFLPTLDEGSIFLRGNFPAGISIQENAKYAPKIRKIIAKYPQISYVITQTGRNDDGTDPFPANRNEILVGLKDYKLWSDTIAKKDLVEIIKKDLQQQIPSVQFSSGQPIIDQVMEIVNGSAADLAVSVVGDDLEMMRKKAETIAQIAKNTQGAENVNIEQEGEQEQLAIDINREQAARFGINVADIQNMIEVAIGGKTVSTLYDGAKRYDIVVRFLPQYRNSIDAIKAILVPSSNGALIPMDQLADIHFVEGQTNIYRYGSKRMITVRTNIRGRDQGSFVKELQAKVDKNVTVPKGYSIIYGGQYENLERAGKQLAFTIPLTIIMVFLFLFMLYKNFQHTMITMSCILFALGGGIMALLIRGYYFNVSAGVGFVSIFGISVMSGVLLVSALNRKTLFKNDNLQENVLTASKEQLRALLSILVVAIVGLIPAATSSGIGSDVQRPLATVIIGGLTSTLFFAPILIPPLYFWMNERK
ncbi:efflux RND transporter permease subunit [Flavobacterium johnsoniae]|uniref:Heavy metal efflux pump, CzcA family n=1 Tax=Flavobacterium johnsoniae (strain ATCC 17061 / DSM 2064 / JCM 8514 / BCRC 14874 / CCUG 350202 / NBRC 14942 / NCIMB 11054 / UW101) TaxID=376686 RepID=A5FBD3_FLAJ1|nr:CusA/CzcA family heavy metal efflux RND transporter [Flavobacterium johnsoniae]ABQ07482.1 heavy metal efflux pump, CzcA family [Flavobacterium johnsoniae UW101]OXE99385.1 cation transporter [Flavobacterium johnsoniae UW101]WQG80680.1 CusA/CzcA family heavy metal efflux RND transporter [Flavobacterium johnsoniae UW101]SHL11625.1 cobalt-zinc-cadmium resistance protein CzcA [Flavobacterium johnsoniae]